MAHRRERFIYAVDRKEPIAERVAALEAASSLAGTTPHIEIVVSGMMNSKASKPIATLIAEAVFRAAGFDHAIIIITHQGLKMTSADTFGARSWNLIVDEVPDFHELKSVDLHPVFIPTLQAMFCLAPDGSFTPNRAIPARDFERPDMERFRDLYDMAKTGGAKASIRSWHEAEKPFHVERVWDASILNLFDSVEFFADSFDASITYKVLESEGVIWEERFLDDHRVWRDRSVTIEYFVESFRASGYQFRKAEIKAELAKVAQYMTALGIKDHLWTTSSEIKSVFDETRIGGARVTPKQAGSNAWRTWHDATMLYSAKPSPDEILVHAQRGMTEDDLIRAREGCDIRQFVMRLSLRDPESTAPVTVRLFDRDQAVELARYLHATYGFECDLRLVDVGVTKPEREKAVRVVQTEQEKKASRQITQRRQYEKRKKTMREAA